MRYMVVPLLGLVLMSCSLRLFAPEHIEGKPWHHVEGGFRNLPDSPQRGSTFWQRVSFIVPRLLASLTSTTPKDTWTLAHVPSSHVLSAVDVKEQLKAVEGKDSLTWIGHATFLVQLDGKRILTDPFFAERASPVSWAGPRRLIPPAIALHGLPPIDIMVVSHNHYDHLCDWSITHMANKESITVVVPLEMGDFFRERGYKDVIELDWWDDVEVDGITVTMLPAVHWSRRGLFDGNEMLWASFALAGKTHVVYHSGDSDKHPTLFRQIAQRMGSCDIGIMAIGAYLPRAVMRGSHMTPRTAVQMGQELGCNALVGQHWGTIRLGQETLTQPEDNFFKAADELGQAVVDMAIGRTIPLDRPPVRPLRENF
ncbi:MAG: MBL fold metallo-hydrolase [Alphaproteobacteria bacterium GM7ARS4]|nr:MBL fold metallo-hydrolase [Alphaproteobacteria bacterium GM7ARS4]